MSELTKNPADKVCFLTEILDSKIIRNEKKIGKLSDLLIVETGKIPEVTHLVVTRSFGDKSLLIPYEKVINIEKKKVFVDLENIEKFEGEPGDDELLLRDHILDKKVLDIEDNELEVVYDVKMAFSNKKLFVVAADFSKYGMLRRMGLRRLAHYIYKLAFISSAKSMYKGKMNKRSKFLTDLANKIKEKPLPWVYIQPLHPNFSRFKGTVKLNILKETLEDIPPVDLADMLEELDSEERLTLFEHLDTELASDTLEEIDPNVQRELVSSLKKEKVALLINEMTPAQAADVLGVLPVDTARSIMELLDKEDVEKIQSILDKQEEKILDYTTEDIIKISPNETVGHIQNNFPSIAKDKDVIMYLYVVDKHDKLLGVIDLKEILRENDDALIKDVMNDNVISLEPESTLKEASAMFARYGYRAIPIMDENEKLLGVVPSRDIMNLKHRFVE